MQRSKKKSLSTYLGNTAQEKVRLAVFDTNIIVSAGIQPASAPAQLIMDWVFEGLIQAVTSPSIVEEYRRVVRRPKFSRYGLPPQWLEFLVE
jgi:putative PIN family toxin of toxin-antitoxin system